MDINKILAEKYNLTKDAFWQLRDKWIITHDAVMTIAEQEGIEFDVPEIKILDERHVMMHGKARLEKKELWTTGEANLANNCKAPYPFAMAEKRWKDRITLMLIGVYHLGVYSEDEADSFKKDELMTAAQYRYINNLLEQNEYEEDVVTKTLEFLDNDESTMVEAQAYIKRLKELGRLEE